MLLIGWNGVLKHIYILEYCKERSSIFGCPEHPSIMFRFLLTPEKHGSRGVYWQSSCRETEGKITYPQVLLNTIQKPFYIFI